MISKIVLMCTLLCTLSYTAHAVTKEEMLKILEAQKLAINANIRLVKKFEATTQWFIAMNEYGYLVVIPMTKDSYEFLMVAYKVETMTAFMETRHESYYEEKEKTKA